MIRRLTVLSGLFLLASVLCWAAPVNAQKQAAPVDAPERWAAVASDDDAKSPVVWGDTKEEAVQRAQDACNRISRTCGTRPAVTPNQDEIFTEMCCNKPRHACAIGTGSTRAASLSQVQKVFDDAGGFSSCRVLKRMSAQTGRRID